MKRVNSKLQKMTVRQLLDEWWKRLNDSSKRHSMVQEVNDELRRRDMEQRENINKKAKRKYVEYFKGNLWKRDY